MEVLKVWAWVPNCAPSQRKEVLPQRNLPGRGCRQEHELRKSSMGGPVWHNQQDLSFVLPDLTQRLCKQAHWGKHMLAQTAGPAVSQCVRADGGLIQGTPQRVMGGFLGSKQIYLHFVESNADQLDQLGVESPFSVELGSASCRDN